MSQHPSLRSSGKGKQHRSVLKRFEKIKHLKEKEKWEEGMSIFGLPKIKILKFKIKKEKAAPEEAVAGAEGAVEGAAPQAAEGAQAKGDAKKDPKGQAKAGAQAKPAKEEKGKK
ncbi:MAG: small basic protein [Candidatus Omnitrophica bacterium]|nr:small basic protein [Candidatus Omnitrophota bacterium]